MLVERRQPAHKTLRRLILTGSVMAVLLDQYAHELDKTSGTDSQRPERQVPELWEALLDDFRSHSTEVTNVQTQKTE